MYECVLVVLCRSSILSCSAVPRRYVKPVCSERKLGVVTKASCFGTGSVLLHRTYSGTRQLMTFNGFSLEDFGSPTFYTENKRQSAFSPMEIEKHNGKFHHGGKPPAARTLSELYIPHLFLDKFVQSTNNYARNRLTNTAKINRTGRWGELTKMEKTTLFLDIPCNVFRDNVLHFIEIIQKKLPTSAK